MKPVVHAGTVSRSFTGPFGSLVVVPIWITALLGYLDWSPLALFAASALLSVATYGFLRHQAKRLNAAIEEDSRPLLHYVDPSTVTTLIATANCAQGAKQAVGTLIERLPQLTDVHLIVSQTNVHEQATLIDALKDHASHFGRQIRVHEDPTTCSAYEWSPDEQVVIQHNLSKVRPGPHVVVDVTGGTAAMTLAAERAATAVGHRITYTAMDTSQKPPHYYGLVDVSASVTS